MGNALKDLAAAGVSVWLDDLSRPLIETGKLAQMVADGEIVGITTNPTIFAKAIGRCDFSRITSVRITAMISLSGRAYSRRNIPLIVSKI